MRRPLLLLLALSALLAAGCGSDDESATQTSSSATATAEAESEPARADGCQPVDPATPKEVSAKRPSAPLDADATYRVTITTNCGEIEIELDQRENPKTAASFAHLASERVFDGTPFHRIVPGFVIQGGDPAANGTGGPGYSIRERPARDTRYVRGLVAMAKAGMEPAGTSGSQFFIVTGPDVGLPPDYAVAGEVVAGMDVVDRIEAVTTDELDAPVDPVVIESATLSEE